MQIFLRAVALWSQVQVVDPICLSAKLVECAHSKPEATPTFPDAVCGEFEGSFCCNHQPNKFVLITIGLFTIVQLERKVQMMIPAYDFCVPDKESVCTSDDPCEMFRRIKFPTSDFFPPRLCDRDCAE